MPAITANRPLVKLELKGEEIHRLRIDGETVIEDKVVATYKGDTHVLTFANIGMVRHYKEGVLTFLAEMDLEVRHFRRADIPVDPVLVPASAPKRPKFDLRKGDLTEEVVEWYQKYRPNEFATRYGQLFQTVEGKRVPVTFTGQVKRKRSLYEKNVNGDMEFKGHYTETVEVKQVIVTTRATHLSYTPEECQNFDQGLLEEGED